MKTYDKVLNNKYTYMVLSKRIKERTNGKNVRIYPVYDKKMNICGIKTVLLIVDNKTDWMIRQILHLKEAA